MSSAYDSGAELQKNSILTNEYAVYFLLFN